jgi:hypothetical protein
MIGGKDILTKEEMLEMNMLYRLYTKWSVGNAFNCY